MESNVTSFDTAAYLRHAWLSETKNYQCIRIEREFSDLIFIKDKSGNIFEIKESNIKSNKV